MSTQYIKISDLTQLGGLSVTDFMPLVQSSSLTTYRVSITTWNALWDVYGSASFANNAGSSLTAISSSHSITASYAISSSAAASASYVDGSNVIGSVVSSSYAFTSSYAITASNSITSSHALTAEDSQRAVSASYALSSSHAQTSSYALIAEQVLQGAPVYGTVPVGSIVDFSGDTVSDPNWAICDGSEIEVGTTYTALASLLGTGPTSKWGAATAGYVRLPDFRKRLTLGANGVLTKLSGSVGNYGGGEFYQDHFHIFGFPTHRRSGTAPAPFDGVYWKNDDFYMPLIGSVALEMKRSFPSRSFAGGENTSFPFYTVTGDNGGSRTQPNGYWKNTTVDGFAIGTSFPFNDSGSSNIGYTADSYNRQDDMAMPYGVVNKIIRIF